MTSCGCFECIVAVLPLANGVMVVNREYQGMTPCGMSFGDLASVAGGGAQTPGSWASAGCTFPARSSWRPTAA